MRNVISTKSLTASAMILFAGALIPGAYWSLSRADEYPSDPMNSGLVVNSICPGTFQCTTCPNPWNGTVVYGASNTGPGDGYN